MTLPVILCDVMKTLVTEPFLSAMPCFFDMPLSQLRHEIDSHAWIDFEKGVLSEEQYYQRFFLDGRPFDAAGLRRCLFDAYAWIDGMETLLDEINARGHAIHALSNYPVWYELIEDKLRLSRYLEWTFVSCKMGVRKPDPAIYIAAVEQLGVLPRQCLFIDDRDENVVAAREMGMDAILMCNADQVRAELIQRKLLGPAAGP